MVGQYKTFINIVGNLHGWENTLECSIFSKLGWQSSIEFCILYKIHILYNMNLNQETWNDAQRQIWIWIFAKNSYWMMLIFYSNLHLVTVLLFENMRPIKNCYYFIWNTNQFSTEMKFFRKMYLSFLNMLLWNRLLFSVSAFVYLFLESV